MIIIIIIAIVVSGLQALSAFAFAGSLGNTVALVTEATHVAEVRCLLLLPSALLLAFATVCVAIAAIAAVIAVVVASCHFILVQPRSVARIDSFEDRVESVAV
jgi:hypothetical protein